MVSKVVIILACAAALAVGIMLNVIAVRRIKGGGVGTQASHCFFFVRLFCSVCDCVAGSSFWCQLVFNV